MLYFWKPFRVVVSLLVLFLIAFIFIDYRQRMPETAYKAITWLQFIPSVREFLVTFGILSLGFVVVLILTLLFGRVYCSVICPLGILQDIISFVSQKLFFKKFRFKFSLPKNSLRYTFLIVSIIPLFLGSITVVGLLDPYSNFGRIFSDFVRPAYLWMNNIVANVLIKFNIYSVVPEGIAQPALASLIYPTVITILIIWLAAKWGRLYCNTICPVGTLLGLVSRISIFKISIDKSSCNQCAKCSFVCKSQCISIKKQEVDFSRCVGCFNCLKSCDNESITYKFAYSPVKSNNNLKTDASKRSFLASSAIIGGVLLGFSRKVKAGEHDLKYRENLKPVIKTHPCSPPGSKSLEHFNDTCTACHLCISACPNKVLQSSVLEYGLTGFLQPYMDASNGYCNFECTKCSEVCPTGAILPLTKEEKKLTQIGKVVFIKENCVVYTDETLCGACSEHCPTKAVKMVPYKEKLNIPEVETDICVGCGACEHACPVRPHRAIYVNGNAVHEVAKPPKIEKMEEEKMEEFPF